MAESKYPPSPDKEEAPESNILSLSAAMLAPLNAIFEAQVHAARAFLNFLLQMGFKHSYEDDISFLKDKKKLTKDTEELKKIDQEIDRLSTRPQEEGEDLSEMYEQVFTYVDENNQKKSIRISNLALIPVRPLAVESANFKFSMSVEEVIEHNQMRKSVLSDLPRPWYLIDPKEIKGKIQSGGSKAQSTAIEIEISVSSTPLPEGLADLLSSLTHSAKTDVDTTKPV